MDSTIRVTVPAYPATFGGAGFHNSEAGTYRLMSRRFFNEKIAKCYREIRPGFMRSFAGFSDWTKDAMDDYAEYYHKMQEVTDTVMYLTPGRGKLHFSEEEIDKYCNDVASNLAYLVKEKGVRHIRYYCFSNELGQVVGGLLSRNLPLFKRYHEGLYRAFQNHGLPIGLLATDESAPQDGTWSSIDWAIKNMNVISADYCGHLYEKLFQPDDPAFYDAWYQRCRKYVLLASSKEKHFILGEYGISKANAHPVGGAGKDVCTFFETPERHTHLFGVQMAELVIASVNANVFALGYWTFCDYPDPVHGPSDEDEYMRNWTKYEPFLGGGINFRYNRWGLLPFEGCDETPRPLYWCMGPMVRALRRNSKILETECSRPLIHACAVLNRDASVSLIVSNRNPGDVPTEISLDRAALQGQKRFRVFEFREACPPVNRFGDLQAPSAVVECTGGTLRYTMPAESVLVITNDYRERITDSECTVRCAENGVLAWEPSRDPGHCYYRVFRDGEQICSTVDTQCAFTEGGAFRVCSVDRYGNM